MSFIIHSIVPHIITFSYIISPCPDFNPLIQNDACRFLPQARGRRHLALTLPRRVLSTALLSPEKKAGEVLFTTPAAPPLPPPYDACLADKTAVGVDIDDDVWGGEDTVKTSAAAVDSHGLISLMGRRRSMEDAVTALSALFPPELTQSRHRFFAVYGGSVAAGMYKERLHHLLAEEIGGGGGRGGLVVEWERVMRVSFARMDKEVCGSNAAALEIGEGRGKEEGETTVVVVVVSAEELVVANCGDTRAVLCRGGVAVPLSPDHKAASPSQLDEPDDTEEVEGADGSVIDSCVPPRLPTDDHYLRPDMIAIPEVTVWPRTLSDDFLILASNSLWDVLPNDAACELVKRFLIHEQCSPRRSILLEKSSCIDSCAAYAAAMLAEMAVARGSKDNVSVIVVMLTRQV